MFTIHEKRLRRAKKAKAHQRALIQSFRPQRRTFTMRPGDHTGPAPQLKRNFFQKAASWLAGVFKGGRA